MILFSAVCDINHVKCDINQVKCDINQVKCDINQVKCDIIQMSFKMFPTFPIKMGSKKYFFIQINNFVIQFKYDT